MKILESISENIQATDIQKQDLIDVGIPPAPSVSKPNPKYSIKARKVEEKVSSIERTSEHSRTTSFKRNDETVTDLHKR